MKNLAMFALIVLVKSNNLDQGRVTSDNF